MSGEVQGDKPMEHAIRRKLTETLNPVHLDVLNESYMHNVPRGSETHFKVVVVSDKFDNLPLIKVQFVVYLYWSSYIRQSLLL